MTPERMLTIARGCTDYGGGYVYSPELYEAYQAGIMTVVSALEHALRAPEDSQIVALEHVGAERTEA